MERFLIARREAEKNAAMKTDVMAGAVAIGSSQWRVFGRHLSLVCS